MRLYLVRHCDAVHPLEDSERPLSDRGEDQARSLAAWLPRAVGTVREIRHSGVLRAKQTAELLAESAQPENGVRAVEGLRPGDSPIAAADGLRYETDSVMAVTHLPLVSFVTSLLLTGRADLEPVVFHTGSIAYLHGEGATFALDWLVHADLLPSL